MSCCVAGAQPTPPALAPSEIVAAAPASDWTDIAPSDLVVMVLAPDRDGKNRRVVIQLMPAPFSQGWVGNIRTLVAARWYDGVSINRVQDNYVVQWGDANADDKAKAKGLPLALQSTVSEKFENLPSSVNSKELTEFLEFVRVLYERADRGDMRDYHYGSPGALAFPRKNWRGRDHYAWFTGFARGWPIASENDGAWPVHCYGMVGVGRGMPPDTGSGAELYTVIGHAPRHLDRNIALVGRVISGVEHLSSLPRGTGPLGFYEKAGQRVPIVSVRMGNEVSGLPRYQYLTTESTSFATYADARANRRDPFFITPAGGADICNIPVPVRVVP
ncbi:MAG: peptidylprolyl isomerase [Sphingomonadaceae bacterium]